MDASAAFERQIERCAGRHDFAQTGDLGHRCAGRFGCLERAMDSAIRYLRHDDRHAPRVCGVHRLSSINI